MGARKTMEFILEQQAVMTARQAEFDERLLKLNKRMDAMGKLVQTGMKILVKTDEKLNALVDAQMRAEARMAKHDERMAKYEERTAEMDARLDRLIKALSRGTNGRNKH
jgi:chromosome segregation ATPase